MLQSFLVHIRNGLQSSLLQNSVQEFQFCAQILSIEVQYNILPILGLFTFIISLGRNLTDVPRFPPSLGASTRTSTACQLMMSLYYTTPVKGLVKGPGARDTSRSDHVTIGVHVAAPSC